jgi:GDPmannose 4,6-dehydratase
VSSIIAKRTALITGISGQDGSYLAELLLRQGYRVYGLTRGPAAQAGPNLAHLEGRIAMFHSSYDRAELVDALQELRPSEVYNFAGQSLVGKSWDLLDDTIEGSGILPLSLLEAIVRVDRGIRFFQASSCEMFSLDWNTVIAETSPIAPGTPYGCAKAFAHNIVACYRNNYGLYAVSGIAFHHESPRRHESFVGRKVVKRAVEIKLGRDTELVLGNLDVVRDWGFAPDVVVAIHKMMQLEKPEDLVICSGETHSLRELVETIFGLLDLDPGDHLRIDNALFRTVDAPIMRGSNEKARSVLNWRPKTSFRQMLEKMVNYEMALQTGTVENFGEEKPFQ